ncbi:orotate phosphoribosyltransferase [bacterium]|nr:orotate phosphoribosyltransferase [bacterium]
MENMQVKIAKVLLETKAVKLSTENPFTWSSGWKSPIYCDNRTVLSFPEERSLIKEALAREIKDKFPQADTLVGVATAGIAMGALLADELGMSYAYCRPEPKSHGLKRQLEGKVNEGASIVVIEDLISTGGSSLKVVEYLRSESFNVVGLAAIFTYGFPLAEENFKKANCPYLTLSNYNALIELAIDSGYVKKDELSRLQAWRKDPENWL